MSFVDGFTLGFWGTIGYVTAQIALVALTLVALAVIVIVLAYADYYRRKRRAAAHDATYRPPTQEVS